MSNYLSANELRSTLQRYKVADGGLYAALSAYEKVPEDNYDDRRNKLAQVKSVAHKFKDTLTTGLKAAKDHHAKPEVFKNLNMVIDYLSKVDIAADVATKDNDTASDKAAADKEVKQPPMLDRLLTAADSVSGAPGGRVRKVMAIAKAHPNSWKQLWYYNSHTIFQFVKLDAKQSTREDLARAGGGTLPYKGDTWVIHPFTKNLEVHCPRGCDDKNLVTFLISMDNDIRTGLDPLHKIQGTEVASAYGEMVDDFIKHVGDLGSDKNHIYSAY